MSRPEDQKPEQPRCNACGQFMELEESDRERVQVYSCCGRTVTRFRPEFIEPTERMSGLPR